MISNIGRFDRVVRWIAAGTIALLYFTKVITGTVGIVLMVLAAILFLTGFVRFCPLYFPFGIRTNGKKDETCCTK